MFNGDSNVLWRLHFKVYFTSRPVIILVSAWLLVLFTFEVMEFFAFKPQ